MRSKKLMRALAAFVLALACLALPALAFAEDGDVTEISQSSFDSDGVYEITQGGNYVLTDNVTGAFRVKLSSSETVNLDLGGFTLTNPSTSDRSAISFTYVDGYSKVYVSNGSIVQQNCSYAAASADAPNYDLILNNVSASATNHACITSSIGKVMIHGGSYTTDITDASAEDASLLLIERYGSIFVGSGTFTLNGGSTIAKNNNFHKSDPNDDISIIGGDWSDFPAEANLPYGSGGYSFVVKRGEDGEFKQYSMMQTYFASRASVCYLETETNFGNIYFESKDDASAWASEHGIDEPTIVDVFKVTFDTDGGVDEAGEAVEPWTVDVNYSEKVEDPKITLYKEGYFFKGWIRPDQSSWSHGYDFSSPVYDNFTLKPVWNRAAAIVDGTYYETLQEAIDACSGSETIQMLKDVTESVTVGEVKDISLDLGGYTLTSAAGKDGAATRAISVTGSAKLTVSNGSLSASGNCVYVDGDATGAEVSLDLDAATSTADSAVSVGAGKLTILGGTYEATEGSYGYALSLFNGSNPECEIQGGKFVVPEGQSSSVAVASASPLTVYAGEFVGCIVARRDSDVTIYGGSFGSADNAESVVEGKCLLKHAEGSYEVLDAAEAKKSAACVATDGRTGTKVYFESEDEGAAYSEEHPRTDFAKVHVVRFVSQGKSVGEPLYLEDDEAYGELPAGEEVSGYTFAGWFVGGDASKRVTAGDAPTFELDHEVRLVAMWTRDGSDEPTGAPTPYDKELPQTGDVAGTLGLVAAAGAALGSIGVMRRRK
jgi:LPXTG-motif cell wall-anchored protein